MDDCAERGRDGGCRDDSERRGRGEGDGEGLAIPAKDASGVVDLNAATEKEEIAKESLGAAKGAKVLVRQPCALFRLRTAAGDFGIIQPVLLMAKSAARRIS